jgi:putative PIN family toxin of toxin-antitoxin system
MHVVVADTNVLVSSIIGKSYPSYIVYELILKRKITLVLSDHVWDEYLATFSSKKFSRIPFFAGDSLELLEDIKSISISNNPKIKLELLSDPDDNKFLELAFTSKADFLITGNTKHFPFGKFQNTEIISPANYWQKYWSEQ